MNIQNSKIVLQRVIGLLAVMVAALWVAIQAKSRREAMHATSAKQFLYERTKGILSQYQIIEMASRQVNLGEGNQILSSCLRYPQIECSALGVDRQIPFGLSSGFTAESTLIVSASHEKKAFYDFLGSNKCQEESCAAWTIDAYFWAECPDAERGEKNNKSPDDTKDLFPCKGPLDIFVRLQVRGLGSYSKEETLPDRNDFESDKTFGSFKVIRTAKNPRAKDEP